MRGPNAEQEASAFTRNQHRHPPGRPLGSLCGPCSPCQAPEPATYRRPPPSCRRHHRGGRPEMSNPPDGNHAQINLHVFAKTRHTWKPFALALSLGYGRSGQGGDGVPLGRPASAATDVVSVGENQLKKHPSQPPPPAAPT